MFDAHDLNSIVSAHEAQRATVFFAADEEDVIFAFRTVEQAFLDARMDGDVRECGRLQPVMFRLQDALHFHARS